MSNYQEKYLKYKNKYIELQNQFGGFITEEQKQEIILYRQTLRSFINENKDKILTGVIVDFPEQPNFINLNIIDKIIIFYRCNFSRIQFI